MYHPYIATPDIYDHNAAYSRCYSPPSSNTILPSYYSSENYNLTTFDHHLDIDLYHNQAAIPQYRYPLAPITNIDSNVNYQPHFLHQKIIEEPLLRAHKHSPSPPYAKNNTPLPSYDSAPFIQGDTKLKFSDLSSKKNNEKNKQPADKYDFDLVPKLSKKTTLDRHSVMSNHSDVVEKNYFTLDSKSICLLAKDNNFTNAGLSNLSQLGRCKLEKHSSMRVRPNYESQENLMLDSHNLNFKQNNSGIKTSRSNKILFKKSSSVKLFKKRNNGDTTELGAITPPNFAVCKRSSFGAFISEPKLEPKLTDFKMGRLLGKGNFGQVYIAEHIKTGFICAMKIIPKKKIIEDKIVPQIIRELKLHNYFKHQNIIEQYGFFSDAEHLYIIIELCTDGQLYNVIKRKKRLTEATTAFIIKQICEGLLYLHDSRIIHRDIKPQNIIINNGMIKICDFGWAVNCADGMRETRCGTPLYLSPEMIRGEQYDESVDIWAVGVLTYELLVGSMPFKIWWEGELDKIVSDEVKFPSYVDVTATAKDFILKIMEKNPTNRVEIEALLHHPFLKQAHATPEYFAQLQ